MPNKEPTKKENSECNWSPFSSQLHFEFADWVYRKSQISQGLSNDLLALLNAYSKHTDSPLLYKNHCELLATIDSISQGDHSWEHFNVQFKGPLPSNPPAWMTEPDESFGVWFREPLHVIREMLANTELRRGFEYAPFRELDQNGHRIFSDFMSGDFSWRQAVSCHSGLFSLFILLIH